MRGQAKPRIALPAVASAELPPRAGPSVDGGRSVRLGEAVREWLLTLEQEHEKASHQDPDEVISDKTCHVCAGIESIWAALKEQESSARLQK